MELTTEQLAKLRVPFEEADAFVGFPEEEIKKLLEEMVEPLVTLAKINLRINKESSIKNEKQHEA